MRNRDARSSHAVECDFATGSFSNRTTPTSWPSGGNEKWIELVVPIGATVTLDSSMDYLDRHLILSGKFNLVTPPDYMVPNVTGANNKSNTIFPHPLGIIGEENISEFGGDIFYTSRGWDGTTLRSAPFSDINNYANPKSVYDKAIKPLYIFVNPFTGALMAKNESGIYTQGVLHVKASPQLNALVSVP